MGESVFNIVCPECGAERRSEKGVRPGVTVRCHECRASFIPIPLLDEDDAPLPPPPLPGKGPRRKSVVKKDLHGNAYQRFEESRRSTLVIGGIVLAGFVGLCASWYHWMVTGGIAEGARAKQVTGKKVEELAEGKKDAEIPTLEKPKSGRLKADERGQGAIIVGPPPTKKAPPPDLFSADNGKAAFSRTFGNNAGNASALAANAMTPVAQAHDEAAAPPARPVESIAETKARSKFEEAEKAEEDARPLSAISDYELILKKYPETNTAKKVQAIVGKPVNHDVVRARSLLIQAREAERTASPAEVKAKYAEIVTKYPRTEPARTAQQRLGELAKKPK